ncbi:MAG: intradiol ring-cleavage dioxygenase, partial [Sphingobacteriales bacterium]
IWHCDKDGNYSEYGGTQMQSTNYSTVHFLRGRQVTNTDGQVAFTSIFPGWYNGRATHIHVHIYNSFGTSLLITQIAFPEGSNSAVVQVNASAANGYTKGMTGYTYNANDNVFSDDDAGAEVATITGSISAGYALEHTIYVNA